LAIWPASAHKCMIACGAKHRGKSNGKKNLTGKVSFMPKKKNEADGDAAPRLPISVCINVDADGELTAVRFSPEAAAKVSRVRGFHYGLSPEKKRHKLRKLLDYDHVVKQMTYFNPFASSYFPHMWAVRAGGKRTPRELFADNNAFPKAMGKRESCADVVSKKGRATMRRKACGCC
jgi:hypothetical protein